jgi:hypothetical protein
MQYSVFDFHISAVSVIQEKVVLKHIFLKNGEFKKTVKYLTIWVMIIIDNGSLKLVFEYFRSATIHATQRKISAPYSQKHRFFKSHGC